MKLQTKYFPSERSFICRRGVHEPRSEGKTKEEAGYNYKADAALENLPGMDRISLLSGKANSGCDTEEHY